MGGLIKMEWDCPFCGTKGISGPLRECPNCGRPMGANLKFHLPKDVKSSYVADEEAKYVNKNPHWKCIYCDSYNSDDESVCVSCGAPRTEENKNYFEVQDENTNEAEIPVFDTDSHYNNSSAFENTINTSSDTIGHSAKKPFNLTSKFNFRIIIIILLSVLGISGLVYALIPKEKTMQVTALSWERSINIERYQTVNESDWSLPYGARLQYTREEISAYEQVIDHYETKTRTVSEQVLDGYEEVVTGYRDLGNGYAEEITTSRPIYRTEYHEETYQEPVYTTVPVYETKYYYEIDKWLYERSVNTSGTTDIPYWGKVTLADDERTGSKSEQYYVTGLVKEKEKTFYFSLEDWSNINIGDEITFNATLGSGTLINEDSD